MADYFSEYSSFVTAKGLPSPADTPYEAPAFLRSKRSSRVAASSRDHSVSPPLPPDTTEHQEKPRDGRYSALDPRRFTPTLHANLVSEILNLRRELDSKNNLVENLETTLSTTKTDNETLQRQLSESAKDVRKAKQQVSQMEKGVYDAVEDLVKERDSANTALDDLRAKLESTQKRTRQQDEDALRTQSIWENDKQSWDNERRQLERRVHVTESRLRTVIDEMAAQHSQAVQIDELIDDTTFKDSGLGDGSDTASIRSATPVAHRRNMSNASQRTRHARTSISSRTTPATPDLYAKSGNTLADELGIDEEDEFDVDETENGDEELDDQERAPRSIELVNGSMNDGITANVKGSVARLSLAFESPSAKLARKQISSALPTGPAYHDRATTPPPMFQLPGSVPRVIYVDTGYQPSPPTSPPMVQVTNGPNNSGVFEDAMSGEQVLLSKTEAGSTSEQQKAELRTSDRNSPISPPQTPIIDGVTWPKGNASSVAARAYSTASTQTEYAELGQPKGHTPKSDSLSPPMFVPAIAIHPPSSRPSSPRPHVLPPGTKNASTQANIGWSCKDASMQTEEIRIDRRTVKLPPHLLPGNLLPSPTFQEHTRSKQTKPGIAKIFSKVPATDSSPVSPALQSPVESSPEVLRIHGSKDIRSYPLKALPLPRPVLSPPALADDAASSNGPLNRSSQYGVSQSKVESRSPAGVNQWLQHSDHEDSGSDADLDDMTGSIPGLSRPPPGRFNLSEPPKAVPEDKEVSPERRPATAGSLSAAAVPSVSSSRVTSRQQPKQSSKLGKEVRSRSPSFGSAESSTYSAQSAMAIISMPPYPIPLRSSSRVISKSQSEGSHSPTANDVFGSRNARSSRSQYARQVSLRKVQSASIIRNQSGRGSPQKYRRRRRSPDLTPVQSMAFESPALTDFPIPELPTPLQDSLAFNYGKESADVARSPEAMSSVHRISEETNLVDAIAATMVGEWMWKYIRKRKSFGIGEDSSEYPVADQNGVINLATGHGTRHKRWVWLSPYERTIMWDTKQPTSGPALLGKKGRKLAIQSVLDVEDSTALPKGPELASAWGRSILILTPERALKFTATTGERHVLWMTALSFLAQSTHLPISIPQMPSRPAPPPPPPVPALPSTSIDGVSIKRNRTSSFGRANVRDSIKLAKGKRPDMPPKVPSSQSDYPYSPDLYHGGDGTDSADFPAVPRLYVGTNRHNRKRSNTSPRLSQPYNNIRSFSSSIVPPTTNSSTHYSHQNGGASSTTGSSFHPSASSHSTSRHESVATSPARPNFFEAVGTVRMEAFVDPNVRDGVLYVPAPPPAAANTARRPRQGSNLSQSTVDRRRAGYIFDDNGMDPFKGF